MRTSRKVALALAVASAALPALGQDRPESILPPGFGEPQPARPATPRPQPQATAAATAPLSPSDATIEPLPLPDAVATPIAAPTRVVVDPATLAEYELPSFARHPLARLGPVTQAGGGLSPDAWGRSDGPYLETLMRRLSAPLPSRWASILLRRALLSETDTPRGADGANFAAERAWLLLRMGESVAARAVVQGVDGADYTPKLYQVAMNAMLATGDPAGLCPLADGGLQATGEHGWVLAHAMCAGLGGAPRQAAALIAAARRHHVARGIDLMLAQKVVGAGVAGQAAITVEWDAVDQLTAWRFGLATATGVTIPEPLMATTGPQVGLWRALAPAVSPPARIKAAEAAAAQGLMSNAALVDLYAALAASNADEPVDAVTTSAAQDLGTAYADASADTRLAAIKRLWGDGAPYARLVLTARAAAHIPPARERAGDADRLIASMLTAGLARSAERWSSVVEPGGDAWAMLALVGEGGAPVRYSDLASYAGTGDAPAKQRLLFAGLAGLGRMSQDDAERAAAALDVRIGATNSWARAIDRAAADGEAGTVVLLAGIGMQTASWRGVPPAALYRIVAALRAVGLEGEARMIAAEAIARA